MDSCVVYFDAKDIDEFDDVLTHCNQIKIERIENVAEFVTVLTDESGAISFRLSFENSVVYEDDPCTVHFFSDKPIPTLNGIDEFSDQMSIDCKVFTTRVDSFLFHDRTAFDQFCLELSSNSERFSWEPEIDPLD